MSTVIKAGQAGKVVRRLTTVDLADHLREATAVIEGAREQASRIIAEAQEQARRAVENAGEQGRVDGFDKGYAEGAAAGRETALAQSKQEFEEKHASLASMFQSAIAWIEETKEQLRLTAEKNLLNFAIMTASKLTFTVGELHREAACENFQRALSLVLSKTDVAVRCNAKDLETLRVFAEELLDAARGGRHVRLVADDSVHAGGCVLQCGKTEVDASLEVQVAEMVSILAGETPMPDLFAAHRENLRRTRTLRVCGSVAEIGGLTVVAEGLPVSIGSLCEIQAACGARIAAQIVALRGDRAVLLPLHDLTGVAVNDRVESKSGLEAVPVGRQMLGTVLNGLGRPIGGRKDFHVESHYPVYRDAPPALTRESISRPLTTGVRTIDAMHTIGGGQRMGIFAGTGVGKSVLMGMIARYTTADVTVVALIGERGREVGDFIRNDLGEEGAKRCVMVVSTSDESPVLRVRAAFVATAVAEYFRDLGKDVLLLMDSTTRMATAQRQIGLAAGEPPTTKGYPPSVFSLLPQLLERSGRTAAGSITGLYTVLVEGDDLTEPIADATRGILDGHIWLSRELANRGHYPAISVNESISRVMSDVVDAEHERAALEVRRVLASWHDVEDLVNVGAYAAGANVEFDVAVRMKPAIDLFLQQRVQEKAAFADTRRLLWELGRQIMALRERLTSKSIHDIGASK